MPVKITKKEEYDSIDAISPFISDKISLHVVFAYHKYFCLAKIRDFDGIAILPD
jgi:hypothetical protein